jgi:hypothetical protein
VQSRVEQRQRQDQPEQRVPPDLVECHRIAVWQKAVELCEEIREPEGTRLVYYCHLDVPLLSWTSFWSMCSLGTAVDITFSCWTGISPERASELHMYCSLGCISSSPVFPPYLLHNFFLLTAHCSLLTF